MIQYLLRFFRLLELTGANRTHLRRLGSGLLLLGAVSTGGFYLTERGAQEDLTLKDAAWWSLVTMTTVGYGDLYPVTWQGRWLVATPTMVIGIGLIGYAIGLVTTMVVERVDRGRKGMTEYAGEGHVILCHCPSAEVVLEVVEEIAADSKWKDADFALLTEAFDELPDKLAKASVHFVRGNPSSEVVLEQAGLERASAVIVLARDRRDPRSDNQSLGAVVTVRTLRPDIPVVVECVAAENHRLLRNAGATEVVGSGSLRAGLIAQGLQDPGVSDLVAELLTNRTGHQFYIEPLSNFEGSYGELRARVASAGNAVALGLVVDGRRRFLPDEDLAVAPGSSVMVIGRARPKGL